MTDTLNPISLEEFRAACLARAEVVVDGMLTSNQPSLSLKNRYILSDNGYQPFMPGASEQEVRDALKSMLLPQLKHFLGAWVDSLDAVPDPRFLGMPENFIAMLPFAVQSMPRDSDIIVLRNDKRSGGFVSLTSSYFLRIMGCLTAKSACETLRATPPQPVIADLPRHVEGTVSSRAVKQI